MIFDGHIHTENEDINKQDFIEKIKLAHIVGGIVLSLSPNFYRRDKKMISTQQRLENVLNLTDNIANFYPFFWIDPMENDALKQVELADKCGIKGFKIICSYFYPGDKKAMEVYDAIAKTGKPILFHSGILWDGVASAKYNRPGEFEPLLEIDGLRFSLAHVSWPWVDENIAVYGKFLNAYTKRADLSVEMFIDISPGTPPIYREEVLTKLFTVGYDIENNIIFGSDSNVDNYNYKWTNEWIMRDNEIYNKLGLKTDTINKIYSENLKRFLGDSDIKIEKKHVKQGV